MRADSRPDPTRDQQRLIPLVSLAVTLLLLFALTYLSMEVSPAGWEGGRLAILTGFVLLVASVAGTLAARVGLPRLTGFIVVGILAGPSLLSIISAEAVDQLRLIDEFALALIALLAGGELKIEALRPRARTIASTTLLVTGVVWVGMVVVVLLVSPLVPFMADLGLGARVGLGLLLGVWAANSSPDLTVAVIEETRAKGPLTDVILGVTIVKDVLVIVLFTLTLALLEPALSASAGGFDTAILTGLAQEVGGALVVGAFLGWIFSLYLQGGEGDRPPIATFLFAYVIVVVANRLHIELLLTGVAAGFVIENLSPAGDRMIRGIES
ncbi:MAG: hypothetical protein GWM92_21940, partial [Gemmatimonadetes bacterium]|nr:hypothetical protein [Gemmatimonadota bacterium]NIR81518.1 hypothetical protein [Gemmatimonadota bacterium]NIT90363.1 hypothetical protein [Gemmatimonadota bacterium]NIU34191.1 hypothetical protein [Gemmatimonadota bacterium]NIU38334.1 hypothetical protein [Gemmatimonadota bacterium]